MGLITRWLVQHEAGEEDVECPMFACDHCQQPIDDPKMGMVLFGLDAGGRPGTFRYVRGVYHKRTCDPSYDSRELTQWAELRDFVQQLARNVADPPVTWHRTKQTDPA